MPIPLGILAQSRQAVVQGDFVLLESQVLSSNAADVTFTGLGTYASTYRHLQLRATIKTSSSFAIDDMYLQFNNDTASNYSWHFMRGVNSGGVASGAGANASFIFFGQGNGNSVTGAFGAVTLDILDAFQTNKFKTIRTLSGATSSDNIVGLNSGSWRNTNAISSFKIYGNGNILQHSRFSLYGVKG